MTKTLTGGLHDPGQPPPRPSDEHAERMVLAALLQHPASTTHLTAILDTKHFTTPAHQQVFSAAVAAYRRNQSCAPADVLAEMARRQHDHPSAPTAAAPEQLVISLANSAPVEAVTLYYAAIIRDLAALRRRHQRNWHPEGLPDPPMRGFLVDEDDDHP
ncbi:DnaB-like helicase N-terminal domain-containing protein [Streptomyces luomodiensis]|uniref:DnaB-like helicase N-terminal domain-containing protein n=1 Tax=Streptomyces luomodiensis TaxID=3026192 RepID=A0ABY9V917_9ACTN|nr:DnaB-like helicase N-terminal domain-containing protein [Streptomyces sp. SCA4-21]WNF01373.1 DnaB-like helicase N-terminal domain-containing protein [Streptomyces sp. SCA4-21]